MLKIWARASVAAALAIFACGFPPTASKAADRILNVSSASTITTTDPYAESESQTYFIWCQVYGCLGRLDFEKKTFVGMLAEKWEVINNGNTWRFTLRVNLKRSDGGAAPTAKDVVHSWKRIMTDPESQQRFLFSSVKDVVAVDDKTVDINTFSPNAQLPADIFGHLPSQARSCSISTANKFTVPIPTDGDPTNSRISRLISAM